MTYDSDLGLYLYLTPAVCCLCFWFALLLKKDRTKPQFYLGLDFVSLGVVMLVCLSAERGWAKEEVMRVSDLCGTAVNGIFILFYCISLMQPAKLTCRFRTTCLLLSMFFCTALIVCDTLLPGSAPRSLQDAIALPVSPRGLYRLAASWCIGAFEIYIAVVVIGMYMRHRRFIVENYSYRENIDLRWMVWIMVLFSLVAIVTTIRIVDTRPGVNIMFDISMLVSAISIFYLGSRQGEIPVRPVSNEAAPEKDTAGVVEAIATAIPSPRQYNIGTSLLNYFMNQQAYLNPELSLSETADAIGTNITYLSKFINGEFNVNFYTFVNNYRIDYAIAMIEKCEGRISSDELAAAAGFKSRSVFYEKFRQRTGLTPQNYILENFMKKH